MSTNTKTVFGSVMCSAQRDRMGFKEHNRSIHFAKEREKLCPVGARVSPSTISPFWDLGLDRTGDWDEGLTKTSSLTEEFGMELFFLRSFYSDSPQNAAAGPATRRKRQIRADRDRILFTN